MGSNKFTILLIILLIALSVYWYRGYSAITDPKKPSVLVYIETDISFRMNQLGEYLNLIEENTNQAIKEDDAVKKNAIKKITNALELYKADNERYASSTEELNKAYKVNSDVDKDPSFTYKVSADGLHYEISIILKDNQIYTVGR